MMQAIALVLMVLLTAVSANELAHAAEQGPRKSLPIPAEPSLPSVGATALHVKVGATEPFSKEDIDGYFKTHNLPRNRAPISDFTVEKLEFLTNKEVTDRLNGASTGVGENDRIGFATLKGRFVFTGPPGSEPAQFQRAYAAFDARTGNLLMVGTLE